MRAGEIVPVDGVISGVSATLDEAALTGEPIPVTRNHGDPVHSGTINAGEVFELRAAAAFGWLTPVASALTQEAIDVAVILNALRALKGGRTFGRPTMTPTAAPTLHQDHKDLEASLDRLREIADALDDAAPAAAVALIGEANCLVAKQIVEHERDDEGRTIRVLRSPYTEGLVSPR